MPPGLLQVPMPPQEKWADIASLVNVTVAFPVLVRVVFNMGLVLPTAMLPKAMLVGLAESVPIDCAKASGVTRITSSGRTGIQRTRRT